MFFKFLILSCLICYSSSVSIGRFFSPIGEPYYVLGIGSACYKKPSNPLTDFNVKARYHDEAVRYFLQMNDNTHPLFIKRRLYSYHHYDVCSNDQTLTNVMVDLLLNPNYTITENPSANAKRKIYHWEYQPKILIVFTYLENNLFRLVAETLSDTNIMIWNLASDQPFEKNEMVLPSFTFGTFVEVNNIFEDLVKAMGWKYVTLVLIKDELLSSEQYFTDYVNLLKKCQLCFNVIVGTSQETDNIISSIKENDDTDTIILLGSPFNQARFLYFYGPSNKTWYLNEMNRRISQTGTTVVVRDERYHGKLQAVNIVNGYARLFFDRYMAFTKSKNPFSIEYTLKLYEDLNFFVLTYRNQAQSRTNSLFFIIWATRQFFYHRKLAVYVNDELIDDVKNITTMRKFMKKKPTQCPLVHCLPGEEYVYTNLNNHSSIWNESYVWTCQPCENGFYKALSGNESCVSCPSMYHSNEKKDSCYDPYTQQMISISQPFTIFAISLSCFGLCSCLIVTLGFVKYRTTPVMKAGNVRMTFVHLFFIVSNFALLFLSFYGKPNVYKCYGRLMALSVFYTIIVSIIQLRLQNVLKAFQSRVKMTKSEVRKSKIVDVFSILILVFTNNCILFLLAYTDPLRIKTYTNHKTFDRISHCGIDSHFKVLIGFTICLQCVCFIQAFRGRRLPGAFKETMSIVYGSFVVILILVISYPIVVFQTDILQAEIVYWIANALSMDVLIVFCYFRRIYVAVFHPELNTVEHSRMVIMKKMTKDSKAKINNNELSTTKL